MRKLTFVEDLKNNNSVSSTGKVSRAVVSRTDTSLNLLCTEYCLFVLLFNKLEKTLSVHTKHQIKRVLDDNK